MIDIVRRLRGPFRHIGPTATSLEDCAVLCEFTVRELNAIADEIERMRAVLDDIERLAGEFGGYANPIESLLAIRQMVQRTKGV